MTGLLKSNYFSVRSNMNIFYLVMLLLGAFVVAADNDVPTLIIGYMLLGMIGSSINALTGLRKEYGSGWGKYKLTAPVTRAAIVKSYYFSHLIWLLAGIFFAAAGMGLSWFFHGFPFDLGTDVLTLFTAGIGISLWLGAFFFPLFHLGGEERNEVITVISLLCAAGVFMGLVSLVNLWCGPKPPVWEICASAVFLLLCSAAAFGLSYPLTVGIFKRREY